MWIVRMLVHRLGPFLLAAIVGPAAHSATVAELTPTGVLRVAIAVSPAPSALYVVKDPSAASGFRGVSIDLGKLLGEELSVPVQYIPYSSSGEITNDADASRWDVTFMPVDEARRKRVSFGNAFHVLQSTYLVRPDVGFTNVADLDMQGVRIGGIAETATYRASLAASPRATHVAAGSVDEAIDLMLARKIDAIALSRESLAGLLPRLPGSRVVADSFLNSTTAIAVPNGRPQALAYATQFIERAKASGAVRRAFDDIGLPMAVVAGAGAGP